ncbi:MAG: hypothetical protein WC606_04040 [Candidatus Absconditabacterales bacterium]
METLNRGDNKTHTTLSINNLSEQEKEVYEIKKKLINSEGFVDMRILTKEELLVQELTSEKYSPKKIQSIIMLLNGIKEDKNRIINKLLMKDILLPKLEKTYTTFKAKGGIIELFVWLFSEKLIYQPKFSLFF